MKLEVFGSASLLRLAKTMMDRLDDQRTYRCVIWSVSSLAFLLTFLVGWITGGDGDSQYISYAKSVAETGSFSVERVATDFGRPSATLEAYRPPAFVALLALSYKMFGVSQAAVVILQAATVSLTTAMAAAVGRRLISRPAGVVVALGSFLFPYSLVQAGAAIDTPLATAALLGCVLASLAIEEQPLRASLMTGAALALAVLVRPNLAILALPVMVWLWHRSASRMLASIALLVPVIVVGAWVFRTTVTVGDPIFVSSNGGWNFWLGNNEKTFSYIVEGKSLDGLEFHEGFDWSRISELSESEQDRYFRTLAFDWIASEPSSAAKLLLLKAVVTALPVYNPRDGLAKSVIFLLTATPLYAFSLWGGLRFWKRIEVKLLCSVIASVALMNVVFLPYTRLISSTYPLMVVLAVLFLASGFKSRSI